MHHCSYGEALRLYMSYKAPSCPLTALVRSSKRFEPALFEKLSYYAADTAHTELSTASLPLPLTHELKALYVSSHFASQLLDASGLQRADVRLLLGSERLTSWDE